MLKLVRRARGHLVTLTEICEHLIRVKPGHICRKTRENHYMKIVVVLFYLFTYANLTFDCLLPCKFSSKA